MTMEAYVLCNTLIDKCEYWQNAIDRAGFVLKLKTQRDILIARGHLPADWNGREAGFECGPHPVDSLMITYPEIDFGGPWSKAYAFYWSTLPGCLGAWIAAAVYARETQGILFDPQDAVLYRSEAAITSAQETEVTFLGLEARLRG